MSEILSQDEVDSLLNGLDSGEILTEDDVEKKVVNIRAKLYDFAKQDKVGSTRMPTFDVINERLSREFRVTFSSLLQANVDVSSNPFIAVKFSEFIRVLSVPTSLHIFRADPLRGHGLVVFESALVYNLIDTFFGGSSTGKTRVDGRDFTTIEELMIKKVVASILKNLEVSWSPVEPVKISLVRSETNPQFTTIVLPTDIVIVTTFEVELEKNAGTLIVCYPYSMIEPMRKKLSSGFQTEVESVDEIWTTMIKEAILNSTVDVKVNMGKADIDGKKLIYMKKGDIIRLDKDAADPLDCYINELVKMAGFAGEQRGFKAFKVEKKIITDYER